MATRGLAWHQRVALEHKVGVRASLYIIDLSCYHTRRQYKTLTRWNHNVRPRKAVFRFCTAGQSGMASAAGRHGSAGSRIVRLYADRHPRLRQSELLVTADTAGCHTWPVSTYLDDKDCKGHQQDSAGSPDRSTICLDAYRTHRDKYYCRVNTGNVAAFPGTIKVETDSAIGLGSIVNLSTIQGFMASCPWVSATPAKENPATYRPGLSVSRSGILCCCRMYLTWS
jgi:hypothetical protein